MPGREVVYRVCVAALPEGGASTASRVDLAVSFFAQACPECGELFMWDNVGRFHEATGDESCGSLQVRHAVEVEEVRDAATLRGRHGQFENVSAVEPAHVPGLRACHEIPADRVTTEED